MVTATHPLICILIDIFLLSIVVLLLTPSVTIFVIFPAYPIALFAQFFSLSALSKGC